MMNRRLTRSILISAALHLAAAAVLFSKQLYFYPNFLTQIGKTPSLFLEQEELAYATRSLALEEAFSQWEIATLSSKAPLRKFGEPHFERAPSLPQIALSLPDADPIPVPALKAPAIEEDFAFLEKLQPFSFAIIEPSQGIAFQSCDPLEYTASLPSFPRIEEHSMTPWSVSEEELGLVTLPQIEAPFMQELEASLGSPSLCVSPTQRLPEIKADFTLKAHHPKTIAHVRQSFSLQDYGLPALHLKEWNELFDVDVKTIPHEEKGFLFSVSLIPKQDLSEYRLKQNYIFIIDRSNSVDRHQYQGFKRAVSRAISALREGDYFNVILLDAQVTSLSENPLPTSRANQKLAEVFLNKQSRGHHGAATDIYSTLTQMITLAEGSHDAMTAILISDGDSSQRKNQQRRKINDWIEANRDRVTLYTATAGLGNNLSSLKMLGLSSRGSLLYSDTHASFPRKLARLVMDLRYPIGKEMTVSVVSADSSARLEMLPPSHRLPLLFSDHPFVFVGSCDKLTDFTLILEGKNRDQDIIIKKTISLPKAKPASRLLIKQWAAEKTHALLDQYLREGRTSLLQQAEKQLGYDAQNSRR